MPKLFYQDTTWFWTMFISLLFLPLMLIRQMKHLTGFSIMGFLTVVYITIIIVAYTFDTTLVIMQDSFSKIEYFNWGGTVDSLSIMMFSYTCQNYVLKAYKDLQFRSRRRMMKASFRHVFLVGSLYVFVGVFGYLTFTTNVPEKNLLIEYNPIKRYPFLIAMISMTISTTIAMAFIVRPCKASILVILYPHDKEKREANFQHYVTIMILYFTLMIVTLVCIANNLNLETILTVISTFTSPLVSSLSSPISNLRLDVLHATIPVQLLHHGKERKTRK